MTFSHWVHRLPWSIVVLALLLAAFGWLGIARSEALAGTSGRLVRQQMIWSAVSLVAMLAVSVPNYRVLCRWSYAGFALSIVLLMVVYLFPPINGAHRWIRIGGVGFQPSEFAKVAFVLMLARYLMYRENFRRLGGLLTPLALTMIPVLLILREPDLGTATVFLPILMLMLWAAGARRRDLALVMLAGVVMLPLLWSQMSREQRSRVTALAGQTEVGHAPTSDKYHLYQAKQMLALGGVWGSYFQDENDSDGTTAHVPEGATDSVFVVLGERFGLLGAAMLLGTYLWLIWRGLLVAERTREPFGRMAAAGLVVLLGVQVIINTAMLVGLLPITGLSLPMVSYGGSGLLAHSIALGLLLNIGMRPGYELADEPYRFAKHPSRFLRRAPGA